MSEERSFGVTEAGLGLTVIICILGALGYWVVQRLGGPGDAPPVEVHLSQPESDPVAVPLEPPPEVPQQPRVLTAEQPDPTDSLSPYTAHRPEWLLPQDGEPLESSEPGELSPLSLEHSPSAWPPIAPDSDDESVWKRPIDVR